MVRADYRPRVLINHPQLVVNWRNILVLGVRNKCLNLVCNREDIVFVILKAPLRSAVLL